LKKVCQAGAVRRGGRVRKTPGGTDVYKSAKEELANKRESAVIDKEDEATEKSDCPTRKITSGKDFVLWENEERSSSRRSSRSSKVENEEKGERKGSSRSSKVLPAAAEKEEKSSSKGSSRSSRSSRTAATTNGDETGLDTEASSSWKIDFISTTSSREGSPSAGDSALDKKDEEKSKRSRRKSPPKKVLAQELDLERDCLSPVPSEAVIEGPVFECMKCGTRLKQRKDLVSNHLKAHKLTFESYIGDHNHRYIVESYVNPSIAACFHTTNI